MSPGAEAQGLDENRLVQDVLRVYGKKNRVPSGSVLPRDEMTAVNIRVIRAWDLISPQARDEIRPFIDVNLDPITGHKKIRYPQFEDEFSELPKMLSSTHFTIHYTTDNNSPDVVPPDDFAPANGTPDYVDNMLNALESIYHAETSEIGFTAPPYIEGETRHHVYLFKLIPDGAFGVTGFLDCDDRFCTSIMGIDSSFYEATSYYPSLTIHELAASTCAHEFMHVIQGGSYQSFIYMGEEDSTWIMEATAVWAMARVYPTHKLYVDYLESWFDSPQLSLTAFAPTADPSHGYGSMIFMQYLWEKYGGDRTMVKLWELARDMDFSYTGEILDALITWLGHDFKDVFLQFTIANYMKDYVDKDFLPDIRMARNIESEQTISFSVQIPPLASSYYKFMARSGQTFLNIKGPDLENLSFAFIQAKPPNNISFTVVEPDFISDNEVYIPVELGSSPTYDYTVLIVAYGVPRQISNSSAQVTRQPDMENYCTALSRGWNMISIPLVPVGGSWMEQGWAVEYSSPLYVSWDQSSFSRGQHPGKGFWVHSNSPRQMCFNGVPTQRPALVPMHWGWNIIGRPYAQAEGLDLQGVSVIPAGGSSMTLGAAVGSDIIDPVIYSYNSATGEYQEFNLNNGVLFDGDRAFWIRADRTLNLSFP